MKINKEIIKNLRFLAENNPYGNPFSACILNKINNKVEYSSNMVISLKDPTAHAEIMVLKKIYQLANNPEDCIIISSGEPCPLCLTGIAWAGIKEVYYLDDYNIANEKGFKFDQSAYKTNKVLKLGLKIQKIGGKKCM